MPSFDDWSSEKLKRILAGRTPENLNLDYKDKQGLLKGNKGDAISKDVSAFLNSNGGELIYGVPEKKNETGVPIPKNSPEQAIGFEKGEITKEQIEDLLTGNIHPRPAADLFRIKEISYDDRIVFVVQVQEGIGEVWQASDKRYYKRFNFKAEPMEHYEIEMVRNKSRGPDLELIFGIDDDWKKEIYNNPANIIDGYARLGLKNKSDDVVEAALIELWTYNPQSDYIRIRAFKRSGMNNIKHGHSVIKSPMLGLSHFQLHWNLSNVDLQHTYAPIFKLSDPMLITLIPISPPCILFGRVQAPRMSPRGYIISISRSHFGDLTMEVFESTVEIA